MAAIHVKLFATAARFRENTRHGEAFELVFGEGATLDQVLAELALPAEVVRHVFVNGERATLDYYPRDGDEVAIFPPIAGG